MLEHRDLLPRWSVGSQSKINVLVFRQPLRLAVTIQKEDIGIDHRRYCGTDSKGLFL